MGSLTVVSPLVFYGVITIQDSDQGHPGRRCKVSGDYSIYNQNYSGQAIMDEAVAGNVCINLCWLSAKGGVL